MKIEAKLFEILTMFFILVAIIYGVFTALSRTGIEWAGLTAIVLSAGLTLIVVPTSASSPVVWTPVPRTTTTLKSRMVQENWASSARVASGRSCLPLLLHSRQCRWRTSSRGSSQSQLSVCSPQPQAWCSSTTPDPRSTSFTRTRTEAPHPPGYAPLLSFM